MNVDGRGLRAGTLWIMYAALIAGFVVGGIYIWRDGGKLPTVSPPAAPNPNLAVGAARWARAHAAPGLPRLMLIGNSVAYELTTGFQATGRVAVFNAAIPACGFPPAIAASYRNPLTNEELVVRSCHPLAESDEVQVFQPDIVLWVMSDPPEPWHLQGRLVHACSQPYESIYKRALVDEVERIKRPGTRVVLTTEAYVRFTRPGNGQGALELSDRTVDCNNRLRREVAAQEDVRIVDLFSWTCPNGKCVTKVDATVLRPDGEHYADAGAVIAARWILDEIR